MSTAPDKINIFIADDHPIVRQGLLDIIERDERFRVIAQAGDGKEALRRLQEIRPDIALLDIGLPSMNGLEILRAARAARLPVKFIILTMYNDEAYFDEAMKLGVRGYLLKENTITDLLKCLNAVSRGDYFISPEISGYLVERREQQQQFLQRHPSLEQLTLAERRVLKLIAANKTSREIADELCLSIRTVQNHRSSICHKLNLNGYNKLLQFALEHKDFVDG